MSDAFGRFSLNLLTHAIDSMQASSTIEVSASSSFIPIVRSQNKTHSSTRSDAKTDAPTARARPNDMLEAALGYTGDVYSMLYGA